MGVRTSSSVSMGWRIDRSPLQVQSLRCGLWELSRWQGVSDQLSCLIRYVVANFSYFPFACSVSEC